MRWPWIIWLKSGLAFRWDIWPWRSRSYSRWTWPWIAFRLDMDVNFYFIITIRWNMNNCVSFGFIKWVFHPGSLWHVCNLSNNSYIWIVIFWLPFPWLSRWSKGLTWIFSWDRWWNIWVVLSFLDCWILGYCIIVTFVNSIISGWLTGSFTVLRIVSILSNTTVVINVVLIPSIYPWSVRN